MRVKYVIQVTSVWTMYTVVATILPVFFSSRHDPARLIIQNVCSAVLYGSGFLSILYMFLKTRGVPQNQQLHKSLAKNLFIIFLWIFYIAISSEEILRIITSIQCLFLKTNKEDVYHICFGTLKVILISIQSLLLTCARKWTLTNRSFIIPKSLVILTNLWLWLTQHHGNQNEHSYSLNFTKSREINSCDRDYHLRRVSDDMSKFIIPVRLEYFMLVIRFLIWQNPPSVEPYTEQDVTESMRETGHATNSRKLIYFVLSISTMINVIAFLGSNTSFLIQYYMDTNYLRHVTKAVSLILESLASALIVGCSILGLYIFSKSQGRNRQIIIDVDFMDYILVISLMCPVAFSTMGLLSETLVFSIPKSLLFILATVSQTIFILIAKGNLLILNRKSYRSVYFISFTIGMYNLMIWFLDVTLAIQAATDADAHPESCQREVFGDRQLCILLKFYVLFPGTIFLRFYSFIQMIQIFESLRENI